MIIKFTELSQICLILRTISCFQYQYCKSKLFSVNRYWLRNSCFTAIFYLHCDIVKCSSMFVAIVFTLHKESIENSGYNTRAQLGNNTCRAYYIIRLKYTLHSAHNLCILSATIFSQVLNYIYSLCLLLNQA